ncbi:MAG TPA: hypothetical protein VEC17_00650 [Candidatus Binatia bacterium]|nr:hypothetical protein [Candidatus Binatia bacterium]
MKKILFIIITLAILGTGWYYFLSDQTLNSTLVQDDGILEVKAWDAEQPISPIGSNDGDAVWYATQSGKLMRLDLTKNEKPTEYPVPNIFGDTIRKIFWPKTGSNYIAVGRVDDKNTFNFYSYEDKTYKILPDNTLNLDWLLDSQRAVLIWQSDNGKIQLVTSNADGTGYKVIRDLPWDDLVPKASPIDNVALMYRANVTGEVNKIYMFDLETGGYYDIVAAGKNTGAEWSPDGERFVYTQETESGSNVFLYNLINETILPLDINATIDQLEFSSDGQSLYAAHTMPDGKQEILETNSSTGRQTSIYAFKEGEIKAKSIFLVGKIVFYIGEDNKLYSIE